MAMKKDNEKAGHDRNRKLEKKPKRKTIKKQRMRIGSWNVRTLLALGKMEEVANELKNYEVDVACLQEVRWGQRRICNMVWRSRETEQKKKLSIQELEKDETQKRYEGRIQNKLKTTRKKTRKQEVSN